MMRTLFRTLIALVYLASATLAQAGFVINSFWSAVPASISFVGCTVDTTNATTYTFTSHATGTAGTRHTIVGFASKDGVTDFSFSSATVGGSSATEIVDSANTGSLVQNAIYIISNPAGTTATIVVTASEAVSDMAVCVWAAYDLVSATATATASQFQTAAAAITLDLNVSADGVAAGMSMSQEPATQTVTWTGMTERQDGLLESGEGTYSGADTATAGTPLTVSADWTGTGDTIGVTASFR